MSPHPARRSPKSLDTSTSDLRTQEPDSIIADAPRIASEDESEDDGSEQQSTSGSGKSSPSESHINVKDETDRSWAADGAAREHSSTVPAGKRRRVSRACDECRRKKIKCDGKQPCTHCSVYSYDCTYDKPSNRRRNPAPQYIEALENRLQRAEALLRKFMPDADLADPNLDPVVQQEFHNRAQARARAAWSASDARPRSENQDAQIKSMVGTLGQLDLSDAGEWDFHGSSSGRVFLRRMREHFGFGADNRVPVVPLPPRPRGMFQLDAASSPLGSSWEGSLLKLYELPPKDTLKKLCYYSLNCATCLLRIVHIPSFYDMLDKLYDRAPESYGGEEKRFLGLLYAVMALGCMYDYSDERDATYKSATEKGIKYYTASRVILQDISECRDMTSLQALLFMILFLQATSNMSDCYAFVGIAQRSALRMGLHRHLPHAKMTPIGDETKRRAFHVIRQMDIYISSILGFPILLQEEDIDQPYPTEVDDLYITKDAILTPPPGTTSYFQAFNAHTRLMSILAKIIKYIYPLKGVEEGAINDERPNTTYTISYSRIKEMERELQEWYEQLPTAWRPSSEGEIEVIRVRTLLRFSYAQVQMMLYRPFLHYISPRLSSDKSVDERYYACAAAGISVCRNIVHIGIEIRKQRVLIGPYWFMLWSQFFSITALVFYVVENQDKPGSQEILAAAEAGRDVIASFVERSQAAERVTNGLNTLFEQLPERLKKARAGKRPIPTKKRSAPGPKGSSLSVPGRPRAKEGGHQRRSEDLGTSQSAIAGSNMPRLAHRTSFDTAGSIHDSNAAGQNFLRNYHSVDLLPLDIATAQAGADSTGAQGTPTTFASAQTPTSAANPLYKLDALMFPSADPFAYPNQPLMDIANQPQRRGQPDGHSGGGGAAHRADSMQFYAPNLYEDIDGQLLGSLPTYLVQAGGQAAQQGLELSEHFYDPPGMSEFGVAAQEQQPGHGHGRQAAAQQRQHEQREFDELQMLTNAGFRGNWNLGGGTYRQL